MASQRREQVVRLAGALDIEFEPGMATSELMYLCITEVESRGQNWGQEPDESEAPPEGFRPALRSVAQSTQASTRSSSRRRDSEVGDRIRVLGSADADPETSEESETDVAEEAEGEVAPALTYTRREKRRGGVRKAS